MGYLIDLYLSPSTQEHNPCVLGDVEETHANIIADRMVPLLKASGVTFARNNRVSMTHWESALDSNRKRARMHYALHTNANSRNKNTHGQRCYYRPVYASSKSVANTLVAWEKKIYYDPLACRICVPAIKYTELYTVKAPIAIIDEIAYHTNRRDMEWVHGQADMIARNKVQAICSALGKKFVDPYAGKPLPPPILNPNSMPEVKRGSTGTAVALLQKELNHDGGFGLEVDGVFGPLTEKAVRLYQRIHKLAVDGIVGPQTWGMLLK
jgi:hypothetical protein